MFIPKFRAATENVGSPQSSLSPKGATDHPTGDTMQGHRGGEER